MTPSVAFRMVVTQVRPGTTYWSSPDTCARNRISACCCGRAFRIISSISAASSTALSTAAGDWPGMLSPCLPGSPTLSAPVPSMPAPVACVPAGPVPVHGAFAGSARLTTGRARHRPARPLAGLGSLARLAGLFPFVSALLSLPTHPPCLPCPLCRHSAGFRAWRCPWCRRPPRPGLRSRLCPPRPPRRSGRPSTFQRPRLLQPLR